jgi:hypothetical protein
VPPPPPPPAAPAPAATPTPTSKPPAPVESCLLEPYSNYGSAPGNFAPF